MILSTSQKSTLKLIARSINEATNWASVSRVCWPLLDNIPAELIEKNGHAESGGLVRFTDKGKVVMEYLL